MIQKLGYQKPFWATILLFFAASFFCEAALRADVVETSTAPHFSTSTRIRNISDWPFGDGEKFVFVIKYQFVAGGTATMETKKGKPINGRPTFQFFSHAKSNKFVDVFFKVRDYNAALVDAQTLATYSFHQNLREGHYKVIRDTRIDYAKKSYTYIRKYKGKEKTRVGTIEEPASDILSAFFQARALPLKLGESYFIRVFSDHKIYSLRIDVGNKVKKIRVPAGTFECVRLRPFIVGDNIFKAKKKGKMYLWVTNDERRIPVLIRSKVFIGAFDAELKEFSVATEKIGH